MFIFLVTVSIVKAVDLPLSDFMTDAMPKTQWIPWTVQSWMEGNLGYSWPSTDDPANRGVDQEEADPDGTDPIHGPAQGPGPDLGLGRAGGPTRDHEAGV